jgi:uroporphyrinogen-III synthase
MRTLSGRTVAILEGRQGLEIAAMVSRLGGTPINAAAVRERPTAVDAGPMLRRLVDGTVQVVVVQTGAGVSALFAEAERRAMLDAVRQGFATTTVVCRGPKPLAVLKRHGLTPCFVTDKPHTTRELIAILDTQPLAGRHVLLLHYGERNHLMSAGLADRGAVVEDMCLYEWALPDDVEPLRSIVARTIAGEIDAMLFTSQVQLRFLFEVAADGGVLDGLKRALNEDVIVGAVGPVCASALRDGGVVADVLPAQSNSACLVGAVADYFELVRR